MDMAAASEQPFRERLVHFWSNHFAVSADKQPVPVIAGLYENEAIRPNIIGKFADLLLAAEHLTLNETFVERTVFPDSSDARPLRGLIKTG